MRFKSPEQKIEELESAIKGLNSELAMRESQVDAFETKCNTLKAKNKRLREALEWIDINTAPPKSLGYDWVLVKVKMEPEGWYGVPYIAELRNGVWYAQCLDSPMEEVLSVKVTHWMPIPEDNKALKGGE